jgi:hypothetical protein
MAAVALNSEDSEEAEEAAAADTYSSPGRPYSGRGQWTMSSACRCRGAKSGSCWPRAAGTLPAAAPSGEELRW